MRRLPVLRIDQIVTEGSVGRANLAQEFEQGVRTGRLGNISCRKGCSNCCSHPVFLSLLEGISLYRHLYHAGLWTSALRLEMIEAHVRTWDLNLEIWALSAQPCPLLKDKECIAYDGRPLPCRVTFSTQDPSQCHPHKLDIPNTLIPRREVLEAATDLEQPLFAKMGIKYLKLPLASAVILGELVSQKKVEPERAYVTLLDMVLE